MYDRVVILGTAHRRRESGKQSPDGLLKEYLYSREIVGAVKSRLEKLGVRVFVDMEAIDLPKTMQSPSFNVERQRELALRVNQVNMLCDDFGKSLYVSVHVNASGSDGKWHGANGWQVCVSPKSSQMSKDLATSLAMSAKERFLYVRQPLPKQMYWEQSLYVLNRTKCPAVLTENMFMDNLDDTMFLLSDNGRKVITDLHVEGIMRILTNPL